MVDILIVGAGPAGLTAAIYARRANKSVLLVEKGPLGGQMTFSPLIENYPGFPALTGNELADKMVEQALALGAEMELDEIVSLEERDGVKIAHGKGGDYEAKAVILAVGAAHRRLGLPHEEDLIGGGISFCAVCDGAFFSGEDVLLAGGGNSAMQEALLLAETCRSVTMIQNLAFLTGEDALKEKIAARENIRVIYNSVVTGVSGEGKLESVTVRSTATGEETTIPTTGLFVAIGLIPDTKPFTDVTDTDAFGYFAADERCRTKTPGVFVAGDCRAKEIRQVSTAAADGAVAALAAVRYLD